MGCVAPVIGMPVCGCAGCLYAACCCAPFVIGLALLLILIYVVFFAVLAYIYVTNKYFLPMVHS